MYSDISCIAPTNVLPFVLEYRYCRGKRERKEKKDETARIYFAG
jgi:hypothetical protein